MSAKRRKVWVNWYPDGRHTLYGQRKDALKIRALNSEGTVPFIERLPGDVVLSSEEWAQAGADAVVALVAKGWSKRDAGEAVQAFGSALLRGRR